MLIGLETKCAFNPATLIDKYAKHYPTTLHYKSKKPAAKSSLIHLLRNV
jgi:hypothetical protein